MPRMVRRYRTVIEEELRLIRLALIDLGGKADMLFSILASIRNEQLEQGTDLALLRKKKRGKKGGA